jgi:hypothetical protein
VPIRASKSAVEERPVPIHDTTGAVPIWQSIWFLVYPRFPPPAPPRRAELRLPVPPRLLSTTVPCRRKTLRVLALSIYLSTYILLEEAVSACRQLVMLFIVGQSRVDPSLPVSRLVMPGRALWVTGPLADFGAHLLHDRNTRSACEGIMFSTGSSRCQYVVRVSPLYYS